MFVSVQEEATIQLFLMDLAICVAPQLQTLLPNVQSLVQGDYSDVG